MKLSDLKLKLTLLTDDHELDALYAAETRVGARKLIDSRRRAIAREREQRINYNLASQFENQYKDEIICGIDEVGRGPLAGPVVACAVILEDNHYYPGLTDSKKLSRSKRQSLETLLLESVSDYAIGIASIEEIDAINIYEASKLAMQRAVEALKVKPSVLLIDAMQLNTGLIEEAIIKGDERSVSISAASVLAKEYRDRMMADYDQQYPGYGFADNAGYGTKKHLEAIERLGITPIHRVTFEPVKSKMLHE
ncbi:ribonuclease HII [Macrococcus lamae]|uniref:Ribonuclease HII n=1 Tax=Macrococcus lamae TaxID=198484 RepID=A0A4R6BUD6_9STAP|nr:ribonuclease HII [Macrococcus lamae]TDM11902.1 ribonuclease HII [Macrococcus lamae]